MCMATGHQGAPVSKETRAQALSRVPGLAPLGRDRSGERSGASLKGEVWWI